VGLLELLVIIAFRACNHMTIRRIYPNYRTL